MGVSTSSKLTLLPGIDGTITNAADSALDSNAKVLDILQNSASATGTQEAIDLANQVAAGVSDGKLTNNPLPTPAFFAHYSTNEGSISVLDDTGAVKFSGTLDQSNNFYQTNQGLFYTQSSLGTSNQSTYWVQATPNSSADGHALLNAPSDPGAFNYYTDWAKHTSTISPYPQFGTLIGKRGIRQSFSPYLSGSTAQWRLRGAQDYLETLNYSSSTYSTWNGGQASQTGLISYNDRTNTLVIIEAVNTSNSYRLHVWRNVNRSLGDSGMATGELHRFMSEAKAAGTPANIDENLYYFYNDFSWSTGGSANYNESRYRGKLFMGDNGKIGYARMVPDYGLDYAVLTPDVATTTAAVADKGRLSATTTYGYDNGSQLGIRHEITWDNEWAVAFSPYYYYGCGMNAFFINTKNPDSYYTAQSADTSWGHQIVPFQESKFLWRNSGNNSDNSGQYLYPVDPSGIAETGYRHSGAISNGANISFTGAGAMIYTVDHEYTSTIYPVLFSPTRWSSY